MVAEPLRDGTPVGASNESGYTGGPEMTLLDHLKELRYRVMVSGLAVLVGVIVCFYFWETILGWMVAPARDRVADFRVSSFSPTDRIGIIVKIGLYGGVILASPVVIYQLLAFIVPGLTPKERRILLPGIVGGAFFLLAGMAFAYWVVLPASLGFLLELGSDEIDNVIGIKQYVDFVTRIIFWVGVAFELPMVLAVAARLGLVRARRLLGFWRYAVVIVFLIAAVVTPTPDPITQTFVAVPLLGLYFIGIVMAWAVQPKRPKVTGPAP
ncbi:twin-arginine translocase subunit TatC [Tepidiforma sp.]|uniref:twin-arginine translocase subunit TatC n=1 Tax=Tepidiforma sp. TaxID=2682230 RepID=UPI002ADE5606|nr:twin-arginine translocase subunit TatC [Tepidiforma sp.]